MKDYLRGAYEMHVHTSPDVSPRKCSDIELAKRLQAAGMGGAVIKCHYGDTAARAGVLNELFPEMHFAGGVTLNRAAGGINPAAVEASGKMGGRFVWFPTMDSLSYQKYQKEHKGASPDLTGRIFLLDGNGELLPEVFQVIETAKKYHMAVATGHISAEEGMPLIRAARAAGCVAVLTHADNPADCFTTEQQAEAAALGAYVEHCYFTTYYDRTPIEEIAAQIRAAGVSRVFLSTDFGQMKSPYSDEGIAEYAERLETQGFTEEELREMFLVTPERLLGIR